MLIVFNPGSTSMRNATRTLKSRFPLLMVTVLFSMAGCSTAALSTRGKLIGVPVTKSVQRAAQLDATHATLPALRSFTGTAQCDVTVTQINYQTPGVQRGEMSNASAALLAPGGTNCPPGPHPLIAYARGTAADKAHTNADASLPETQVLMILFAAQGYAVVATDYLGYALSGYPYHPYMQADTEASVVIDSIRAARNAAPALGLALNGKVMLSGFSQGDHAAMAAQRAIEQQSDSEFNVVAATHMAGPYSVSQALIDGVSHPIGGVQALMPFQIVSWQKIYGNVYARASDVFNAPYDGVIETLLPMVNYPADLAKLPGGTPPQAMQAMFKPAYLSDLAGNPANGTIMAAKKQDLFGWNPKAPTTLCAAKADPVVKFFHAQMAFDDFTSRGLKNVSLVDVDAKISQAFGSMLAKDPVAFFTAYHGTYDAQFCSQVTKTFFDLHR
jgi:pimeloyl-ACP methyl ester carboxylesterase